jgi:hypothetical protein
MPQFADAFSLSLARLFFFSLSPLFHNGAPLRVKYDSRTPSLWIRFMNAESTPARLPPGSINFGWRTLLADCSSGFQIGDENVGSARKQRPRVCQAQNRR